jgi:hypothetical protein
MDIPFQRDPPSQFQTPITKDRRFALSPWTISRLKAWEVHLGLADKLWGKYRETSMVKHGGNR